MSDDLRNVRLPLMVTRSEAEEIDAWRYASHIPSRAEAVRRLIAMGLEAASGAAADKPAAKGAVAPGAGGRSTRLRTARQRSGA